jgi:hypothetical protein
MLSHTLRATVGPNGQDRHRALDSVYRLLSPAGGTAIAGAFALELDPVAGRLSSERCDAAVRGLVKSVCDQALITHVARCSMSSTR